MYLGRSIYNGKTQSLPKKKKRLSGETWIIRGVRLGLEKTIKEMSQRLEFSHNGVEKWAKLRENESHINDLLLIGSNSRNTRGVHGLIDRFSRKSVTKPF